MMENQQSQSKVYLNILERIKGIIHEKNLLPGDKLPSERELADTLNVGRSSVREALRAMELLGLIETRRGEGTYVGHFHKHQLVELLGWFVLQREHADNDVIETRKMLEVVAIIQLITKKIQIDDADWIKGKEMSRTRFVNKLIEATGNVLLEKIWQTLLNFENTFKRENDSISIEQCKKLLNAIHHVDTKQAISIYMNFFDQQTKQAEE